MNAMEKYKDLDGDSGVVAYEIGSDSITVEFGKGATYLYNYESAGSSHIEKMKELAVKGDGLNRYINKYVKKLYAANVR